MWPLLEFARGATSAELQVLAQIAGLVDEHGPGVEPPPAVDPVEGVVVVAGDDDLQRQFGVACVTQ
jgi:hypothetical protein